MTNHATIEERVRHLESSASRWRGLTLVLLGAGLGAVLIGSGSGTPDQDGKSAVRVDNNGYAVVEDVSGQWSVIYQAGVGVFKRVDPQR